MVKNNSDQVIETFSNQLLGEEAFISIVELGKNDIPHEIFNLEDKKNQGIIEEINENTFHNPSLESSKHNEELHIAFDNNNSNTRQHAYETPHEGKNDNAETKIKEDDELKEGTNENIGHQEKILS